MIKKNLLSIEQSIIFFHHHFQKRASQPQWRFAAILTPFPRHHHSNGRRSFEKKMKCLYLHTSRSYFGGRSRFPSQVYPRTPTLYRPSKYSHRLVNSRHWNARSRSFGFHPVFFESPTMSPLANFPSRKSYELRWQIFRIGQFRIVCAEIRTRKSVQPAS